MGKTDPRQIQAMREYLDQRFSIKTDKQLFDRIRETPKIDLSIFRKFGPVDNYGGQKEGTRDV